LKTRARVIIPNEVMSARPLKTRRRDGATRAAIAAALAVVCHVVFAGLLVFLSLVHVILPPGRTPSRGPQAVSLRPINADQWAKNRASVDSKQSGESLAQSEAKKEPEKKKADAIPKGQVVDVAPGNGEESEDAKYLAESANKVKKESRAKEQTAFYRNAMPQRTSNVPQAGDGRDSVDKAQVAGNQGLGNDDRPLKEPGDQKSMLEVPDVKKRQEIALKTDPTAPGPGAQVNNQTESAEVMGNSNRLKIQQGDSGEEEDASQGKKGSPGVANLTPSASVLDKIVGAAANDHLGEVEEGEGTYLNTKEWKYSTFFNRVKQSVGMHWSPANSLRQRDPTGNIYGGRDRYTVLNVTLNDRGMVKDIYVEKSCGLDFLDLEAIQSFERAQPFPNPPPGLITGDSTVRFSFGFFLEMGGGPRMRLFRQAN
jgi:TonB family protein